MRISSLALAASAALAAFGAAPAFADLALTPQGITDGFVLSTFVGPYPNTGAYGPLAQGIASNGNVITGSVRDNTIYVFHDTDGQSINPGTSAVTTQPYACQTGNCNWAMTTAGGQVYGAQAFGGVYEKFNSDGTFAPMAGTVSTFRSSLGMWGAPNGHIISSSASGLIDITPSTGAVRVINAGLFPDGVSVSANGAVAFVENGGTVQSYDIGTGALIHTFLVGHSPDGTGVIVGGAFNGDVVVNNNDGTVGLLDPTKADGDPLQYSIIADGGTRGDFTSPDTSNGTLFLSQIERVDRLSCGPGCSIGVPPSVPEPATLSLVAVALGGLMLARRRRR